MPYESKNKYGPVHVTQRSPSISTWDSSRTYSGYSPCSSNPSLSKSGSIPKPRENRKGTTVVVSQYDYEMYGSGDPSRRDMVQNKDRRHQ